MVRKLLLALSVLTVPLTARAAGFQGPLAFTVVHDLLRGLIFSVVYVGMPVAIIYLVYSGFLFTAAQGNPQGLTDAKTTFIRAVVVLCLLLSLWGIVSLVGNTLAGLSAAGLLLVIGGFLVFAVNRN